ncbi:hypothetical protein ACFLQI_01500 [Candidatus Undinarchaeota archaeon]
MYLGNIVPLLANIRIPLLFFTYGIYTALVFLTFSGFEKRKDDFFLELFGGLTLYLILNVFDNIAFTKALLGGLIDKIYALLSVAILLLILLRHEKANLFG